jgi:cyclic pyranopterin phosphate synthase
LDSIDKESLTHISAEGEARMVDVSGKADSPRRAVARGFVRMQPATLSLLRSGTVPKGDALATARVAGIMAAKRTPELIPLCHQVPLSSVQIDMVLSDDAEDRGVEITAACECVGPTGVEMEALAAASVCALTLYDMCKAVDRTMSIEVELLSKEGGASGGWIAGGGSE